jgi:Predicted transcriptional regulators
MIIIDYKDRRPIYEQVVERFQDLILKGVLEPDSQLPSVRNLAMDLSINPNTIQRAYAELERQGFIYSVKGKGSFIAANESLIQCKKDEILNKILQLTKEARNLGITKEQFLIKVEEGFEEGSQHD